MNLPAETNNFFRVSVLSALLMVASFIATDIYLPSLPAITHAMHTTEQLSQLTLSLFLLGFGISQYIFGLLSDRFGRKPMVIIGVSIFIFGSVILTISNHINLVLIGRLIQGLGIGAAGSIARVILRDVFSGPQLIKIFSMVAGTIALAPAMAPALGGIIQHYAGFRGNFIFMLAYGVLLLVLVLAALPETLANKDHHAIKLKNLITNTKSLFNHKGFIINIMTNGLAFSIIIVSATILPFLMQNDFHVSPRNYGLLTLLMASGMAIGMYANSKFIANIPSVHLSVLGFVIVAVSALGLMTQSIFFQANLIAVIISVLLFYFGVALVLPNVAAAIFHPFPKMVGLVGATYGSLQIIISAVAGMMATTLKTTDPTAYAVIILTIAVIAGLLQYSSSPRRTAQSILAIRSVS